VKSALFNKVENTKEEDKRFTLQNQHMLLVNLNGEIYAKQGSMSAYQGEMDFEFHGGGAKRMFKKIVTGENLHLMKVAGKGDLFLADNGAEVYIVNLENEQLTVNSTNLLAFESGLEWNVNRIKAGVMGLVAGGLFNTTLTGSGDAALTSWGEPVVLQIDEPTCVDVNCVIAWTTNLEVSVKSSFKAQSLIGRGSGEAFQMQFSGKGFVVVQPGEGPYAMMAMASSGRR
jgi:uncharacterized protein (AIM24 family)